MTRETGWDLNKWYRCFGFEVAIATVADKEEVETDRAYGLSGWRVRLEFVLGRHNQRMQDTCDKPLLRLNDHH